MDFGEQDLAVTAERTDDRPDRRPDRPDRRGSPDALDRLTALVEADLRAVNRLIVERMDSPVPLIPQLASYIVASGGKRLRPMLTLAAAQLCGYAGTHHVSLAAAVEFIHTATLLHDDVVDESGLRRGQASANEVFGNKPSVLVGDFLFARAFQLMVESGSIDVLGILSRASAVIAEGEVLQLAVSNDLGISGETYLRVIRAKTAELFAAACRVGAVVASAPPAQADALWDYGLSLGLAFQLVDDALDYSAEQARLGKAVGDDFRDGKVTLPVLIAAAAGTADERAFWRRTLEDRDQRDGDLDRAIALLRRHDAFAGTIERARFYAEDARRKLAVFPARPIRGALIDILDFVVDREF